MMNALTRPAAKALFVFSLFASMAFAQTMTIDPDLFLTAGSTCDIFYSDPAKANMTVVISVTKVSTEPIQEELFIELDANGYGSVTWDVPYWRNVSFGAPDVPAESMGIFFP